MLSEDLGLSVLKSACNAEAKELAADWADLGLESLSDQSILKDAPIFGSVVKVCAISRTIRDRLFLRKIWEFLRACPKFNDLEKMGFAREHLDDPEKAQKLSNAIVLILDRLDDLEKTDMLAKMFAAFVRKKIDLADFRRLAAGIDRAFVGDLKILADRTPRMEHNQENFLRLLEPAGFVVTGGGISRGGAHGTRTDISNLGKLFQQCMWTE